MYLINEFTSLYGYFNFYFIIYSYIWLILHMLYVLAEPLNRLSNFIFDKCHFNLKLYFQVYIIFIFSYKNLPGDYCKGVTPDPIPNSAVKPFSANGTLS